MKVRTQAELNKALAAGDTPACVGTGEFVICDSATVEACDSATVEAHDSATVWACDSATVWACDSATVKACDSATVEAHDSATVEAHDSATVKAFDSATVKACDSATVKAHDSATVKARDSVTVEACDSVTVEACDSVTVEACDSVTVRAHNSATVKAFDSATVEACDSVTVNASRYVAVTRRGTTAKVAGGVIIQIPEITTAQEWIDFYGVQVKRGLAIVFKAVRDNFESPHGTSYKPGTKPKALDWDPVPECGGGLHFSPRPRVALKFAPNATRYVACPVRVDEIVVHQNSAYPDKIKAPRVAGPIYEVDKDGERL